MDIEVTDYGTVKWSEGDGKWHRECHEMPIKEFLKKLKKKCNDSTLYLDDDNNITNLSSTDVYSEGDDYTIIEGPSLLRKEYHLSIKDTKEYYPTLKKNLEGLAKKTEKRNLEMDKIDRYQDNDNPSISDTVVYYNSLKKIQRRLNFEKALTILLPILSSLGIISSLSGAFSSSVLTGTCFSLSFTTMLSCLMILLDYGIKDIAKPFKLSKIIKLKIKEVKRLLKRKQKVMPNIKTEMDEPLIKRDLYKNSVINYMYTIMESANKLDNENRHQKLITLRGILDEYMDKCRASNTGGVGLTLSDTDRAIAVQTLDKLTTLDMEIADLIKKNNENSKVLSESDDLRKRIDEYLEVVNANEQDISSKKVDKKLRVRTM